MDATISSALSNLPVLSTADIPNIEDSCPICLFTFKSIITGSTETVEDGCRSSNVVTKVDACGHMFCMEDLAEWIRNRHGTCPSCRYPFLPDLKPSDSDDEESSDGGEYLPTEYDGDTDYDTDFEDGDGFPGSDGFDYETMEVDPATRQLTDTNGETDEPRRTSAYRRRRIYGAVDSLDEMWRDGVLGVNETEEHEWGLTDGESMGTSEGELSPEEQSSQDSNIQIRLSSSGEYAIDDADEVVQKSH